jgi:hypothetical protein
MGGPDASASCPPAEGGAGRVRAGEHVQGSESTLTTGPPGQYPSPPEGGGPHRPANTDWSLSGQTNLGPPAAAEPALGAIGDIAITRSQVITPAGALPLRGSIWTATDMSRTEEYLPTYAVVLAIVFFVFCLLGLLFLLMKARRTVGFVQVTVNSAGRFHSTMLPVSSPQQVYEVMGYVNWARSLAAQA